MKIFHRNTLLQQLGDKWDFHFSGHVAHEIETTAGEKHMSEKNTFEAVRVRIARISSFKNCQHTY